MSGSATGLAGGSAARQEDGNPVAPGAAVPALVERLARLPEKERVRVLRADLGEGGIRGLFHHWPAWAHAGQLPPPGDWRVWMVRAGRGFGKTRAGAEWISAAARNLPNGRIALVGDTVADVARVMVEGESGLIATARAGERYSWRRDAGVFTFASGAQAFVYSANAPESLRGPEHHVAWCDELGKWDGEAAWDNLLLGLRLGDEPRVLVTTTPRRTPLMRRLLAAEGLVQTRGTTRDNLHLPASFVAHVEELYGGTRLGRQELDGEMMEDVEGALWPRALIEAQRLDGPSVPQGWARVVVGVDPPAGIGGDACGIVAVARTRNGHAHVLEDASVAGASPEGWARAAAACAARHGADRLVAEANQGGEMVRATLLAADEALPVTLVHASRGKVARAEPVAALYETRRAWHAGVFAALEEEMAGLAIGGGYAGPGRSPDRADALVWAMTELMLGRKAPVARVRVI